MIASALCYDACVHTDPGSHAVNQDFAGSHVGDGMGVWAVADGLGSRHRSEVGARLAVEAVLNSFGQAAAAVDRGRALEVVGREAHEHVVASQTDIRLAQIRTTLAVLVADGSSARWLHVGDTRVYHWRESRIASRTADHSVPQLLVQAGEIQESEIRGHPDASRLLAALGQSRPPSIEVSEAIRLQAGDAFLICTDGWWQTIVEADMTYDLMASDDSQEWIARMSDRIARSRQANQDHYTAFAVRVVAPVERGSDAA